MKGMVYKLLFFSTLSFLTTTLWAQPACIGTQGELKWLLFEGISDDELDDLTHLPIFPNQPDDYEPITGISSPGTESDRVENGFNVVSVYYGSKYGSLIRGYLKVGVTGNYSFNITGDDEVKFLLSTDDTRDHLVEQASVSSWTFRDEYADTSETNQTSALINLEETDYYYFEVWHKEHSGGDHVEVKWKTPANNAEWQDIPAENLYDYACTYDCPPSGTSCDDGNANTVNDKEDGFCNCIGTPTNVSSCIGTQGEIKALYYLEIPGNSMSSLYAAEKYPLMPDTTEILDWLKGPLVNRDTYGVRISGFLKVPLTGDYQFNVTCDDRASFNLSTTESPDDLVELSYSNWSSEHDHYRHESQITPPVTLNKDNFYYFEMHHREGTGGDRFSAFWRTPFTQDTLWRYIDKAYIYGYNCEMACIPEGTPCDDGNAFTNNDQYDEACNCIGTPCRGSECDETPTPTYNPTETCGVTEKADNAAVDNWESCSPSPNPNLARGTSHWIQYDLGQDYLLNSTHIWNYNGSGATGKGFKEVVLDYSSDGVNWTQFGNIYQWDEATGAIGYEGFEGPNFNGIIARYVLITALNSWGNELCSGFSKITIEATDCLLMGQSCDDGDPNSVNERYDENCNCIGEGEGYLEFDPCGVEELLQGNISLAPKLYQASARIVSEARVDPGIAAQMAAGESVTLLAGFHAQAGSNFIARVEVCTNNASIQETPVEHSLDKLMETKGNEVAKSAIETTTIVASGKANLSVYPNPTNSWTSITFDLPKNTIASLCIYSTDGKLVSCLSNNNHFEEGSFTKEFPAQQLTPGMYFVVLKTDQEVLTKPIVVMD